MFSDIQINLELVRGNIGGIAKYRIETILIYMGILGVIRSQYRHHHICIISRLALQCRQSDRTCSRTTAAAVKAAAVPRQPPLLDFKCWPK